jgi:hypothetical protein
MTNPHVQAALRALNAALAVVLCAATMVFLYFLTKLVILGAISMYFLPATGSLFMMTNEFALKMLAVLLGAEYIVIAGVALRHVKKVVEELINAAKNEKWKQPVGDLDLQVTKGILPSDLNIEPNAPEFNEAAG